MPGVFVTKLAAIHEQLDVAITLFFNDSKPISVHTLTAASYNVLRDLNKKQNDTPMLAKSHTVSTIKEAEQEDFRQKLNQAENFFKHADKDADKVFFFKYELTEYLLYDACVTFERLADQFPPVFAVFKLWFMMKYPSHFNWQPPLSDLQRKLADPFDKGTKPEFFRRNVATAKKLFGNTGS